MAQTARDLVVRVVVEVCAAVAGTANVLIVTARRVFVSGGLAVVLLVRLIVL